MTAETALMLGLATVVFLVVKLAKELEEADTQINKALFVGSNLFLIGMLYTGYGIAQSTSIVEAERTYLAALVLVAAVFVGLLVRLFQKYRKDKEKTELEGFGGD